jgi:hypothetical protein
MSNDVKVSQESQEGQFITADVENLFLTLPAPVQEIVEQGRQIVAKGVKTNVMSQWQLGFLIGKLESLVSEGELDETVGKVALCWGHSNLTLTTMYNLRNVAKCFSSKMVKEELEKPMKNGSIITWSHLYELQKIGDPDKISGLLEQVRENSWSAKELKLQLSGESAPVIARSGGRKPTVPTTPVGIVTKIFKSVQQTENYINEVLSPIDELIESGLDYDDNLDARIKEAIEQLSSMSKKSNEMLVKLKKLSSIAGKVVKPAGVPKKPGRKPKKETVA